MLRSIFLSVPALGLSAAPAAAAWICPDSGQVVTAPAPYAACKVPWQPHADPPAAEGPSPAPPDQQPAFGVGQVARDQAYFDQQQAALDAKVAAQRKAETEREAKARAALDAKAAKFKSVLDDQDKDDAATGYEHTTVQDFLLDYRSLASGSRVVISGYHFQLGRMETLSKSERSTETIYVDTAGLSRPTRKAILDCHDRTTFCDMTIWAHTGCTETVLGYSTDAPCLVVDAIRPGPHTPDKGVLYPLMR